ncbi:hypothetical protein [Rhodococcus sp. MS13]|uniref:hypothetical protein n=1 Tax=Rhodococcus sp. MS13 TaxID=2579940 RepID=UPI0015626E8E|nr:hypothetical protein [Rhodococcus sp. MS13]NRH30199.1 hypothetical protein [Rhodococcus sp. MS13]
MDTLTMTDIATLARVKRPVVSMWRKRPIVRGESMPFPTAVTSVDGIERFSRADIVEWLDRTGRGNNVDGHRLDAPGLTVPAGLLIDDAVTLLCWCAATSEDLSSTSISERREFAHGVDPRDEFLAREIDELEVDDSALQFIDDVVGASFGSTDALDRLENSRLRRDHPVRGLTPDAIALVRSCVRGASVHLGVDDVVLAHHGDPSLALAACDEGDRIHLSGTDATVRAARRRALLRGVVVDNTRRGRPITVASVVGLDVDEALNAVDDLTVSLEDGDVAVILGSAATLSDHQKGPLQTLRAEALRVGNTVAALRLPRGMWREAVRQNLAMWICCGGAKASDIQVGDLDVGESIDLDDLAADVAAVVGDATTGRALRYARSVTLPPILAGGAVVAPGTRASVLRSDDAMGHVERVQSAAMRTAAPMPSLDIEVAPAPGRFSVQTRSLAELQSNKRIAIKAGKRIRAEHALPDGTVAVLPDKSMYFDPVDAERLYPRSRTEPGDVIFVEHPRPQAWVDDAGGSLVASPAKIIRLRSTSPVGSHLLAAIITTMAPPGTEWKSWPVPVVADADAVHLEQMLIEIAAYQQQTEARLNASRDLATALITGVAAGALVLDPTAAMPITPTTE